MFVAPIQTSLSAPVRQSSRRQQADGVADLRQTFAVAGGSVCGREHRRVGRNNQDAWAVATNDDALLVVVCDGCSSGTGNELGARLGARLLLAALYRRIEAEPYASPERLLEGARLDVLLHVDDLARAMGGNYVDNIRDHFLFTAVGAIVRHDETSLFILGDGVIGLNGRFRTFNCPGNAPPYLAYALIRDALRDPALADEKFIVPARCPTAEVCHLVVASDGADDLQQAVALGTGPGLTEIATDERYVERPHLLERQLALLNRERTHVDWSEGRVVKHPGRLGDDTTVVVLQRR
jgi:hypothetical protein